MSNTTTPKYTLPQRLVDLWWISRHQSVLETLKSLLTSTSTQVLGYVDFTKLFVLETVASDRGLGAVLLQVDNNGKGRMIAYASRWLRPTEKNMDNYSSMKLELLALECAVTEKFQSYLIGSEFEAFTDNNPLKHLAKHNWAQGNGGLRS